MQQCRFTPIVFLPWWRMNWWHVCCRRKGTYSKNNLSKLILSKRLFCQRLLQSGTVGSGKDVKFARNRPCQVEVKSPNGPQRWRLCNQRPPGGVGLRRTAQAWNVPFCSLSVWVLCLCDTISYGWLIRKSECYVLLMSFRDYKSFGFSLRKRFIVFVLFV